MGGRRLRLRLQSGREEGRHPLSLGPQLCWPARPGRYHQQTHPAASPVTRAYLTVSLALPNADGVTIQFPRAPRRVCRQSCRIMESEAEAGGRRRWTGTSSRASGKSSKAMRGNSGASSATTSLRKSGARRIASSASCSRSTDTPPTRPIGARTSGRSVRMRCSRMRPSTPESHLKEVKSYEYLADNTDHSGGTSGLRWIRILKTGEVIVVSRSACSEGAGSTQTQGAPLKSGGALGSQL